MATTLKTAVIRKTGWPTTAKTFGSNATRRIGLDEPETRWCEDCSYNAHRPSALPSNKRSGVT